MRILAIDPGNVSSGWCVIDAHTRRPLQFGLSPNETLLELYVRSNPRRYDKAVIEMVASYGMPVGAEVFATVRWIGRYEQAIRDLGLPVELTSRLTVKLNLCHDSRAKDPHITQALVDRFANGQPNHGKGTKANPGWFHGFRADVWAAYALAVTHADSNRLSPALST